MLHHGLYEQIINNQLTSKLAEIPEAHKAAAPNDKAEASKVQAQCLVNVVQKGLNNMLDNGGDISSQIELSNQIVALIQSTAKEADFAALVIVNVTEVFSMHRNALKTLHFHGMDARVFQ